MTKSIIVLLMVSREMTAKPVVVHSPEFEGEPATTEYFLPQPKIAVDHTLHPWMQSIARSAPEAVADVVAARFKCVEVPVLKPLCKQLLRYTAESILVRGDQQWLHFASPHQKHEQSHVLIPPPVEPSTLQEQQRSCSSALPPSFLSFMEHFAGIREHYSTAGHFIDEAEEWTYLTEDWQREIIDNFDDWTGSLLIFHSSSGDHLLLHPDGHLGWWLYGEGKVEMRFPSFDDFLKFYVQYREKSAWPLDAYGPPPDGLRKDVATDL